MNRAQLLRAVDAAAGRRGVARLRALIDGERQPRRTRSAPERRLLNAIVGAGLPAPLANHAVGGWEADLYWPGHGLVVEVDGSRRTRRRGLSSGIGARTPTCGRGA